MSRSTPIATRSGSLARLFPGSTSNPGESQPVLARLELFDAVAALVRRLSRTHPLMLVVEDLHWATAPTVLLLRHLIEEHNDQRLLIVGTYREGDLEASHPLRELLADTRSAKQTTHAHLDLLTRIRCRPVGHVARSIGPVTRIAAIAETVHGETTGNPFFASELLHHLASTGQLDKALEGGADHRLPIPDLVHDVLGQRLARLAPGTHELPPSRRSSGPRSMSTSSPMSAANSPTTCWICSRTLLAPAASSNSASTGSVFVHAIVRNALLDELSASRRARVHRRVAEALEARGAEQFDELARHWQLGGGAPAAWPVPLATLR
ncbi:MAG: hypothetical protein IPL07_22400 [Acidimicrobiaceae bacterium]|nr:hypothetical protein [Acidimicrobiaceae bacterium]